MICLVRRWRLLRRARRLHARARVAHAARHYPQADALLEQVEQLLLAAQALRPQGWSRLGMGPAGWCRFQFLVGVANAYQMIDLVGRQEWALAGFSLLVMVVVSQWKIPTTKA
jgi:hypothetical protein